MLTFLVLQRQRILQTDKNSLTFRFNESTLKLPFIRDSSHIFLDFLFVSELSLFNISSIPNAVKWCCILSCAFFDSSVSVWNSLCTQEVSRQLLFALNTWTKPSPVLKYSRLSISNFAFPYCDRIWLISPKAFNAHITVFKIIDDTFKLFFDNKVIIAFMFF